MDATKREKLIRAAMSRFLTGGMLQSVTKTGEGQYLARCLSHKPDNNPSMSVNAVKGLFNCFSCGYTADALDAYQLATGKKFAEAAAELEAAAGITETRKPEPKKQLPRRVAAFPYRDETGTERYSKERWEPGPEGRNKSFAFYHPGADGKREKGRGGEPIPYHLDRLAGAPEGSTVYFTEGEKKADLLAGKGMLATSLDSGAASPWKPSYTEHFRGKRVVIVPDRDEPGEKYAARIAAALDGTAAGVFVLRLPGLAESEDVLDWQGRKDPTTGVANDAAQFLALAAEAPAWKDAPTAAPPVTVSPSPETVKKRREGSTPGPRNSERLLALFWENPLYRDTAGNLFIEIDGALYPLDSKGRELKELMAHAAFESTGKTAGDAAVSQTIAILSHRARTEGETLEFFTRTGDDPDAFWYDLGNKRAVRLTPAGWEIVRRPLWFRTFSHQLPQPDPVKGGDPWKFFDFVNTKEENRLLALCVMGTLFVPRITRPLIHFIGCQGSGKTFAARLWKRLYDPSPVDLSSIPRKEEDLDLLLFRNAFLCLDNLSYMPPATADRLCSFISGAAIERRSLFTDLDTTILQSNCVVAITSITELHNRPDLTERTIRIEHDRIDGESRRTERDLLEKFDAALPEIMGGMLDMVCRAMAIHPTVTLHSFPRLADAAGWMYALAESVEIGRGRELLQQLGDNSTMQSQILLDGDSFFAAIVSHLDAGKTISGSFGECLATLMESAKPSKEDKTFPQNANGFRSHLSRLQVPLEHVGITYTIDNRRTSGRRSMVEFFKKEAPLPVEEPATPEDIVFNDDELTGDDL